jgi:hypothetical protein
MDVDESDGAEEVTDQNFRRKTDIVGAIICLRTREESHPQSIEDNEENSYIFIMKNLIIITIIIIIIKVAKHLWMM